MLLTLLILAVEKEGKGFFLWARDDKTPRIYVTRLSDMFNAVTRIMLSTMTGNLSHISLSVAVSSPQGSGVSPFVGDADIKFLCDTRDKTDNSVSL